jgi:pre-mRNA-splicing factor ISY1
LTNQLEWEEAFANLRELLNIPADVAVPPVPRLSKTPSQSQTITSTQSTGPPDSKRKAPDEDTTADADVPMANGEASSEKRSKTDVTSIPTDAQQQSLSTDDVALRSAQAAAAFIPFLSAEELLPPKLPTKTEMEEVLLALRKKQLLEEYFDE